MVEIATSKYWLFTSPHRPLNDYEQGVICEWKRCLGKAGTPVYDLVVGTEGADEVDNFGNSELHTHIYVEFTRPHAYGDASAGPLPGWDIRPVPDDDTTRQYARDYTCKGGNYYWARERIPYPYNTVPTWRPWQAAVIRAANLPRQIVCVVDRIGNTGKTFLSMWHAWRHKANILPIMKGYQDLMRSTAELLKNQEEIKLLFVDLPRALPKNQLRPLWSALESIKNGYAYDDRYRLNQRLFKPPKIVVFTNAPPDLNYLSRDRWFFIDPSRYIDTNGSRLQDDTQAPLGADSPPKGQILMGGVEGGA